jgi:hypothetical protein
MLSIFLMEDLWESMAHEVSNLTNLRMKGAIGQKKKG